MVYLIKPNSFREIASSYSGTVIDSARVDHAGNFSFNDLPESTVGPLLEICVQKTGGRFNNLLIEEDLLYANYMPVYTGNGSNLKIKAVSDQFQSSYSLVNPDPVNEALLQLRDIRHKAFLNKTAGDQMEEEAVLEKEDALKVFQEPLIQFADTCSNVYPALVAIRWVSPVGDYERLPEFVYRQCEKWSASDKENAFVPQLCQMADPAKLPLMIGHVAPDYPMPMENGDTLPLHSLLGKRLTILDIWASWCAPCRKENRAILKPLWESYSEAGLNIIGYSIDASAGAWKAAIKKDEATWAHASHLSGDSTPFMEKLNISTIPANFLLDAEGKVIAKNLHGEALAAFVLEYMAQ